MRKILNTIIVALTLVLVISSHGFCKDKTNLYNLFRKKAVTKVYIPPIENLSDNNKADADALAKELKDALSNRKSIVFEIVDRKEDSDIAISCNLVTFFWSDKDPVDLLLGTYAIAYDMLTTESYAFQEVVFTVIDTKKAKILWSEKLKIDYTKKGMTEDESIPLINKKTVKTFIRDCFSKRYSRPKR